MRALSIILVAAALTGGPLALPAPTGPSLLSRASERVHELVRHWMDRKVSIENSKK